jgi:parafibromin
VKEGFYSLKIMDETAIKDTLVQWASKNLLAQATLSDDGSTLSCGSGDRGDIATIPATAIIAVEHAGKSCAYSVASVFLQILDPNRGLIPYRNACKKYGVGDPVKALDKPTVVGFFLARSSSSSVAPAAETAAAATDFSQAAAVGVKEEAAAATASSAAAAAIPPAASVTELESTGAASTAAAASGSTESLGSERREVSSQQRDRKNQHHHRTDRDKHERRRSSSSRKDKERDRHRDRKHGSRGKHGGRDREGSTSSTSGKKKKKAKAVTNEQLFSNLSMVVDKRRLEQKTQEEIAKALSAEGFQVTSELLERDREVTGRIVANEIPVGNSASILRASNPKKTLSRVLELYLETVNPARGSTLSKGNRPASSTSSSHQQQATKKPIRAHLIGKKPVIVVPKGMTAPLTLVNAHEFFCNGRFVPRDVMLKQLGGGRAATLSGATTFTRKIRASGAMATASSVSSSGHQATGLLEFEIMDNPKKLGNNPKEWERIVAVIVLGQPWQFKDWPSPYNNPVHLFSQTMGYFVSMEGDKIPSEISGWAVRQGKLNRDKRGLDSVTHAGFWNALEEFMAVHRPELLPQHEV